MLVKLSLLTATDGNETTKETFPILSSFNETDPPAPDLRTSENSSLD